MKHRTLAVREVLKEPQVSYPKRTLLLNVTMPSSSQGLMHPTVTFAA